MRRNRATTRVVAPDAKYRSRLVQQVINKVMLDGKKSTAERIVYDALAIVGERSGRNPTDVLDEAIDELTPVLEVRSRRVGGATYQVPVEVPPAPRPHPRRALARRFRPQPQREVDVRASRARDHGRHPQQGGAYKRKDDIYRMAQANKAFAHYRW